MVIAALMGLLFGFVGSIPMAGPIWALVFSRALQGRTREGFTIAVGCALAEAIYAGLALWGIAELLEKFSWIETLSNGLAAVILLALGVLFVRHRAEAASEPRASAHPGRGLLMGFTITVLNPTLIATWSAASAMLLSTGLVELRSQHAIPFGLGALAGIVLWFAILLRLVGQLKERFSYTHLAVANRAMGVCLLVGAFWFGWQVIA